MCVANPGRGPTICKLRRASPILCDACRMYRRARYAAELWSGGGKLIVRKRAVESLSLLLSADVSYARTLSAGTDVSPGTRRLIYSCSIAICFHTLLSSPAHTAAPSLVPVFIPLFSLCHTLIKRFRPRGLALGLLTPL